MDCKDAASALPERSVTPGVSVVRGTAGSGPGPATGPGVAGPAPGTGAAMDVRAPQTCSGCAHERAAHEHCRPGTDCALCDCAHYRAWSWAGLVTVMRGVRRHSPRRALQAVGRG